MGFDIIFMLLVICDRWFVILFIVIFVKIGYYNSGYSKLDWLDMLLGKKYDLWEYDWL